MSKLHLYENGGGDKLIAKSPQDAADLFEEVTGDAWDDIRDDDEEWDRINPKDITIFYEDHSECIEKSPKNSTIYQKDGGYWFAKAKTKSWIKSSGRGWLCSENW